MFKGKNVNIRLIGKEDLDIFMTLANNLYNTGDQYPYILRSELDMKEQYNNHGFWNSDKGRLLITDKDDRIVGQLSFFRGSYYMNGFEIGYQIFDDHDRGKGFTTEAVKILAAYLFEAKPITRLQICMEKENYGSAKVAEKAGFTHEGTLRDVHFDRGRNISLEIYSMIRSESTPLKTLLYKE